MSRTLIDIVLSRYYQLRGVQYYTDDNIGRFSIFCDENGYNSDMITEEIEKTPQECGLTEFDLNFPTNKSDSDRIKEIFDTIKECWSDQNAFILDVVIKEQRLLFDGYIRKEILSSNNENGHIPIDIINLFGLFFEIDMKILLINIQKACNDEYNDSMIDLYKLSNRLSTEYNAHFLAFNVLSMLISGAINEGNEVKAGLHFGRSAVCECWGLSNEAINDIELSVAFTPKNVSYKYQYGSMLYERQKYEEALQQLMDAGNLGDDNQDDEKWKYYIGCARCYAKLKNIEQTKINYTKAIEVKPEFHYEFAEYLKKQLKDYETAAIHCKKAMELKPSSSKLKYHYGKLLQLMEKWEDALVQFLDAYNMKSSEPKYVFQCGKTYEMVNDYDNAKIFYLKAIELDRNKKKYRICYAKFLYDKLKDVEGAKMCFMKAIEANPNNCNVYYQYGKFLRDYVKDYKSSEIYYQKCLEIDDKDYGSNGSYGYLLYLMGKYDKAEKHLKIELDIKKKNNWAHFYMGLLYNKLGNDKQADKSLTRAVELTKNSPDVFEHINTMKKADPESVSFHEKFEKLIKVQGLINMTEVN